MPFKYVGWWPFSDVGRRARFDYVLLRVPDVDRIAATVRAGLAGLAQYTVYVPAGQFAVLTTRDRLRKVTGWRPNWSRYRCWNPVDAPALERAVDDCLAAELLGAKGHRMRLTTRAAHEGAGDWLKLRARASPSTPEFILSNRTTGEGFVWSVPDGWADHALVVDGREWERADNRP